jgi:hypothetical protein
MAVKKFYENSQKPLPKTIVAILLPIIIGVLSSIYTTDITTISGMKMGLSFNKLSFYLLLVSTLLLCVFYYLVYKYETDMLRYHDNEFCVAYIRSQLITEMADNYRRQIRSGQMTDLSQMMEDFMRALQQ